MRPQRTLGCILIAAVGFIGPSLVVGCATTEYYGDNYPMTAHVDIYWDQSDIHRPHRVIGRAVTTEGFGDSDEMIQSIREEAMSRGAHGVVITKLGSIVTGETESGKSDDEWRHTTVDREERIESKFIRYTD